MIGTQYLEKMAMNIIIPFVFRQLSKYQAQIDWAKVESDIDAKIKQILPYAILEEGVEGVVHLAIKAIKAALGQGDTMQTVVNFLVQKQWSNALDALKGIAETSLVGLVAENDAAKAKDLLNHVA